MRLHRGYDITKSQQKKGPFPVVSSSGISSRHDKYKFAAPGVVIGRKGSIGTAFYIREPYWPHDTTLYVEDFKGNDPRYCYYLLKTMGLERYDVGASNPTLNRNHLHELSVTLADRPSQLRIASILGAYDDLIENNTRRIEVLDQIVRDSFEEWFVRFRGPGDDNGPVARTAPPSIPKKWSIGKLGDLAVLDGATISPGVSPDVEFSHYSYPAFDAAQMPIIERGENIQSNKLRINAGVVLLAKLNPRIPRIWLVIDQEQCSMVTSTEFMPLRPREPEFLSYLFAVASSDGFMRRLQSLTGGTSTSHQRAKPGDVMGLPITIPPDEIVLRYCKIVSPMLRLRLNLVRQNSNLRDQRDLLLPRLISGEIGVSCAECLKEAAE